MSHLIYLNDFSSLNYDTTLYLPKLKGSKVLLTGGAGFLGYNFCRYFKYLNDRLVDEEPISVVIWDNFSRGIPKWVDQFKEYAEFDFVKCDITTLEGDRSIAEFDWIVHAASIASPIFYRQFPIETMDANVTGLRNLLNESVMNPRLKGFLYFSTSEIYGDPDPGAIPTDEDYRGFVSCTGPRACYDESKRFGETLCVNFADKYGVPITTVRPFNNYGPGLPLSDGRVISDFSKNILSNAEIVLLSSGSPTRTFCYVTDAVDGYLRALVAGRRGQAYNVGVEDGEISIRDLASLMSQIGAEKLGYSKSVRYNKSSDPAYLIDNPNRRCPNIGKARLELGFEPKVPLATGLEFSFDWYLINRSDAE